MVRKVVSIFLISACIAGFANACPCGPELSEDEKFFIVKIFDGCPCWEEKSVEEAYKQSDGVFIGKVVDIQMGQFQILNLTYDYKEITFDVIKAYKGNIINGKAIIRTGTGNSDCGYPFLLNGEYLVYGSLYKGNLYSTNACTRTIEVTSHAEEELKVLAKLKESLVFVP